MSITDLAIWWLWVGITFFAFALVRAVVLALQDWKVEASQKPSDTEAPIKQSPVSETEWRQLYFSHINDKVQKFGLPIGQVRCEADVSFVGMCLFFYCITAISAFIGLPASTLLSVGDPHEWSFKFRDHDVGGSITSLVFLLLYPLFYDASRRFSRIEKPEESTSPLRKLVRKIVGSTIYLGTPLAVIIVWTGT